MGFHKKWYLFKMPLWLFLFFEMCFSLFWIGILFFQLFSNQNFLAKVFILLMFANGIQHIVWFGLDKKYNPGLATAVLHLVWASYSLLI